jgi:hypothetical protein
MKSQSQFGPLHWWTATLPSDNTRLFAEPASRTTTSSGLRIGTCQENGGDSSAYLNVEAALAKYYDFDRSFLIELEPFVRHYTMYDV